MTSDDLKQIREVIREELQPTNERLGNVEKTLGGVENKLDKVENRLDKVENKLDTLWDQVVEVTTGLDDINEEQGKQTAILKRIDEKCGDDIKKLSKRITTVETHAGISAPPELMIIE